MPKSIGNTLKVTNLHVMACLQPTARYIDVSSVTHADVL